MLLLRFDSDPNKHFIQVTPKNVPPVPTTAVPTSPFPTYSTQVQTLPDDKIKSLGYRPKSSSLPLRLYTPATRPTSAPNPHVSTLSPLPNKYQASLRQTTTVPVIPIDYSAPVPTYPTSSKQSALPYVSSLSLPSDEYRLPKGGKMLGPMNPPSQDYLPPSDQLSSMQPPAACRYACACAARPALWMGTVRAQVLLCHVVVVGSLHGATRAEWIRPNATGTRREEKGGEQAEADKGERENRKKTGRPNRPRTRRRRREQRQANTAATVRGTKHRQGPTSSEQSKGRAKTRSHRGATCKVHQQGQQQAGTPHGQV